jgi:hypothetical protein
MGKYSPGVMAMTLQPVPSNPPTEQPKSSVAPVGPANAQVRLPKQDASTIEDLSVVGPPVPDVASGDSAKALMNEATGNVAREHLETYRPALQGVKPSTVTEERQAEKADLERICVSRYGERCTGEATVHCPKCGRWFCDAHGEDEKWHTCALVL